MPFSYESVDEIWEALKESLKLQSHYAELLNMYDGGKRLKFEDANEWIIRLRRLKAENAKR